MNTDKMNMKVAALLSAVAVFSFSYSASAEIEYLDYIDSTGSQWVDTGIVPNRPTIHIYADFTILEKPSGTNVTLFGTTRLKDNPTRWEGSPGVAGWSWITSLAFYVGANMNAMWTGGAIDQGGYYFSYSAREHIQLEGWLGRGTKNGTQFGGHYDVPGGPNGYHITTDSRYNYGADMTFYVGTANNAGAGLVTGEGYMPKARWYGFKLTDGDETLCDLVPAKDGASVGFYDKVSKRMLTSQGADPFVEPEIIVWKGGGTTPAWSDGSNWKGGVAPTDEIAMIPDNCKALARMDDVATMNNYGLIWLQGDNSILSFSNLTAGVQKTLTVPIRGKGLILVEQAASTGDQWNLRISGDNSRFSGNVKAQRSGISVGHRNALGIGGTFTANMTGSQRVELDFSGVMPNDCYFGGGSMIIPGSYYRNPELSGVVHVTDGLSMRGYDANGWLILSGGLVRDVNASLSLERSIDFRIPGLDLSTQATTVWANGGTKKFRGGIKSLGQTAYAEDTWICTAENAFGPKFGGSIRLGTNGNDLKFDLNGFDQQYGTMYWMAAGSYCKNFIIRSATPATLTIYGEMRNDSLANTYCGRVQGAASIELNSTNSATASAAKFAFGQSETTGGFTARRGTIELQSTATFSNATHLVATETGLLKVQTADIGNTTNLFVAVTNATTAKIEIAADLILKADTALMGEKWLDAGRYSSVAGEGVTACPQLSGTGILDVRRYGGKKGLIIFLR